jgi:hypothetical protein
VSVARIPGFSVNRRHSWPPPQRFFVKQNDNNEKKKRIMGKKLYDL